MTKNTLVRFTSILIMSFLLSGCAAMLSSYKQTVNVMTATPDAVIRFEGDSMGTGTAKLSLQKKHVYNIVTAEKEGYRPRNHCIALTKRAPAKALIALDVLAFAIPTQRVYHLFAKANNPLTGYAILIPAPFLLFIIENEVKHAKVHLYKKNHVIPPLDLYEMRKSHEKFLLVDSTNVSVKASDQVRVPYSHFSSYGYKDSAYEGAWSFSNEDIKVSNTIFDRSLNHTLHKMHFIDTANNVFPNFGNTLYLDATIRKFVFHDINSQYSGADETRLFSIELTIDWNVLNFYREKITTLSTVERSDLFCIPSGSVRGDINNTMFKAMRNNMEVSVMNVRRQLEDKGLLKIGPDARADELLEIPRPAMTERKKEKFSNSCVRVTTNTDTGTATIISADGYLISNYHLVATADTIKVTFSDSTTANAVVVRKNKNCDIALLRVDKNGLIPFTLLEDTDPEIGADVWAVGLNTMVGGNFRLSRGIISGVRKTNGLMMLQTDVSLNAGNSGCPLISDKGEVLGVVSFKMVGRGIEGIGFALSGHDVMEKLNIRYK